VAEWLGRWTCDQQVAGSNPGLPLSSAPWASCYVLPPPSSTQV